MGTGLGRLGGETAVMTLQPAGQPVIHQPGAAVHARDPVPAATAERKRRVAPPVEKQQRLLAGTERPRHRLAQDRRQPGLGRQRLGAHVDRRDFGNRRAAEALGEDNPFVAAAPDIDHGLEGGRRGGENDRAGCVARAYDGDVAGVVDHPVFLLEAAVVLLVDDDQAEIGKGQEQRRARADDNARLAAGNRAPGLAPARAGDVRVPMERWRPEAGLETAQPIDGECDFRQQHQHLPAAREGGGDRFEIDFGLA